MADDKTFNQWALKIIGGFEFIIAGLLSALYLLMLFMVVFKQSSPPHGHSYLILALMALTPILLLLWLVGMISWQGKNPVLAWVLQIGLLIMLVVFGVVV